MPRVVVLCLDGGSGPVESQVVDHLRLVWREPGAPLVDLLLLGRRKNGKPPSPLFSAHSAQALQRETTGNVVIRAFSHPAGGFFLTLGLLFRMTFSRCFSRRLVIHARAKDGGLLASVFKWLCLGFPKVIYDARGDLPSELRLQLTAAGVDPDAARGRLARASVRWIEWLCLRSASRVLYVSRNLQRMVEGRYPFARCIPSAIFPCMGDSERFRFDEALRNEKRTDFGFSPTDRVLAYSGHLQPYQCFDEMMELIERLTPRRPDMKVLFLTTEENHEHARSRLAAATDDPSRFVIRELPHDEIPGALNAADVGLLLRHQSPVNEAASPTKFAEYLLCGLPVVLTEGIGDASRMTADQDLGVVLPNLNDLDEAARMVDAFLARSHDPDLRRRIAAAAQKTLSRQLRITEYIEIYRVT